MHLLCKRLTSGRIPATAWVVGVVAAVLVVAVVWVFALPLLVPKSSEQLYEEDRIKLHKAVLVYITGYMPHNVKNSQAVRRGSGEGPSANSKKDTYPTKARIYAGDRNAIKEDEIGNGSITMHLEQSVPGGSKNQSGTPDWEDVDGDGVRIVANDILYYHKASPDPTVDHWNTVTITSGGTRYVVDSQVWFIDIDDLVAREYLKEVPKSASPDNSVVGKGSYSWYVGADGEVKSMPYSYPISERDGFQGIYP